MQLKSLGALLTFKLTQVREALASRIGGIIYYSLDLREGLESLNWQGGRIISRKDTEISIFTIAVS